MAKMGTHCERGGCGWRNLWVCRIHWIHDMFCIYLIRILSFFLKIVGYINPIRISTAQTLSVKSTSFPPSLLVLLRNRVLSRHGSSVRFGPPGHYDYDTDDHANRYHLFSSICGCNQLLNLLWLRNISFATAVYVLDLDRLGGNAGRSLFGFGAARIGELLLCRINRFYFYYDTNWKRNGIR